MALTRAAIVEAGLSILDAYGLGDLSMRRVADVLGVQAGALYYHVPNKQSLLAALSDEILASVAAPPADLAVGPWLTGWALALRRALLTRRDAAELVSSALAFGLGSLDPVGQGRARLSAEGFVQQQASMEAMAHFVLGHVMQEQTRAQMHALGVVADFDAAGSEAGFRWGVSLLVHGIQTLS